MSQDSVGALVSQFENAFVISLSITLASGAGVAPGCTL